jgi:hypothetical protein
MIITRLNGGLGNQMFQYSLGRNLSLKCHSDLYFDISLLEKNPPNITPRNYELNIFNIKAYIASSDLLKRVPFLRKDAVCLGIRKRFTGEPVFQYVKEKDPNFHDEILSLSDNVYLDGYWQSEKYFSEIVDIIRKEFSFVNPPSAINQELLEKIVGCNSVSVHIRRGDYVSNPKNMEIHGVLEIDYYMQALKLIRKNVKDLHVFVFSDDLSWVRNNLKTDFPLHFIGHNGAEKDYEDLRLMSNCKHHIIANSSFSWWGAWLCKNSDKIIYAPKKWFKTPDFDARNLIPDSWFVI